MLRAGPKVANGYDQTVADSGSLLLLIDTCGNPGSVALASLGPPAEVVGSALLPGRSASERLLPAIREVVSATGNDLGSLKAIAVVHGPGSFTGIRVGLSAAKGLCQARGIPLIAISRLAVLAEKAGDPNCLALLDAGRGELYTCEYVQGVSAGERLRTREDVAAELVRTPGMVAVACEAAAAEMLSGQQIKIYAEPTAADALNTALCRLADGKFDDLGSVDANYGRWADGEIFASPARAAGARI